MLRLVAANRERKTKIVKLDAHNFIIRHCRECECISLLQLQKFSIFSLTKQRVKPVILYYFYFFLVEKFSIFFLILLKGIVVQQRIILLCFTGSLSLNPTEQSETKISH